MVNAEADRQTVNYECQPKNAKGDWICANELQIGDKLQLANGTVVSITAMQVERLDAPQTTYNFEVSEAHTYYVSDSKILVHNMCQGGKPNSPKRLNKSEIKKFDAEGYKEMYVGNKGSRFDIFKDISDNDKIWLGDKAQKTWIETEERLFDLFNGGW